MIYPWEWRIFCKTTPKQTCALLWSMLMFLACYNAYFIGPDINWSRILWVGSNITVVFLKVCGSVLYCCGRTSGIVYCLDEESIILCLHLIADPQNNSQTACKPSHLTDFRYHLMRNVQYLPTLSRGQTDKFLISQLWVYLFPVLVWNVGLINARINILLFENSVYSSQYGNF